ncbi:MAG: class I SAM-dependent methyltransferase [Desulfarculaceae bacterium]|jgi:SAM-dependent methyltransferase
MIHPAWERNYQQGRFNKYPFDKVVSFVFRNLGKLTPRDSVKVLDLGCGGGTHAKFLTDEGFAYWGIDGSAEAVRLTKERIKDCPTLTQVQQGDFCALPYENDFFDAVIDRQSMAHNSWQDIQTIVKEIHRVLRPGGLYYGQSFSNQHPDLEFGRHLGENDYNQFSEGTFFKSEFVHAFDLPQLEQAFAQFQIISLVRVQEHNALSNRLQSEHYELTAQKPLPDSAV